MPILDPLSTEVLSQPLDKLPFIWMNCPSWKTLLNVGSPQALTVTPATLEQDLIDEIYTDCVRRGSNAQITGTLHCAYFTGTTGRKVEHRF